MNLVEQTQKDVHEAERTLLARQKFLAQVKRLECQVSGLRWMQLGRSSERVIASSVVLHRCDKVSIRPGCTCCCDATYFAYPYLEVKDALGSASVFFTERFEFGDAYWGEGVLPHEGWEEGFASKGVPEAVIEAVRQFLREHPPTDREDDGAMVDLL